MTLFQPHEIRYAQKNTEGFKAFSDFFFDNERKTTYHKEKSKVYIGTKAESLPKELMIEPDRHTVKNQLIWQYHSLL